MLELQGGHVSKWEKIKEFLVVMNMYYILILVMVAYSKYAYGISKNYISKSIYVKTE